MASTGETIALIKALGGGGGGGSLPAVTYEDAGRVLTVSDEGEWVAGSLPYYIRLVYDTEFGENFIVDGKEQVHDKFFAFSSAEEFLEQPFIIVLVDGNGDTQAELSAFNFYAEASQHRGVEAKIPPEIMERLGHECGGAIIVSTDDYFVGDLKWFCKFIPDIFTITLTPTAADFSGTVDKTAQEIALAVMRGQRIRGYIPSMNASFFFTASLDTSSGIRSYILNGIIIYEYNSTPILIQVLTTNDNSQLYSTNIYTLTPYT